MQLRFSTDAMVKIWLTIIFIFIVFGCTKNATEQFNTSASNEISAVNSNSTAPASPPFNLEVILRGADQGFGHVKFRQDNDIDKIISLETWVRDLEPNHEYQLQRAVDPINIVDGECTSNTWLTLGVGADQQSIITDDKGTGKASLWRSVAMLASGSAFDIHFRIIDKETTAVVLTSDCYKYVVR